MAERLFEEVTIVMDYNVESIMHPITLSRVPDYIVVDFFSPQNDFPYVLSNETIYQGGISSVPDYNGFYYGVELNGNTVTIGYGDKYSMYEPTITIKAYVGQVIVDDATLFNIANAIREKNGTEDKYLPSEMASAIQNIKSENCDKLISKTITEVSSNLTTIGKYVFYDCTSLQSADFPKAVAIGDYAFYGTSALTDLSFPLVREIERYAFRGAGFTSANFPEVTYVATSAFAYNSALTSINIPKANSVGGSAFQNCTALQSIKFPELTAVNNYTLGGCSALQCADFDKAVSLGTYVFQNCSSLKAVILRGSTMCTLANENTFSACYHILGTTNATYNPNGNKDGYIYVPAALVNTYKADTKWATFASQIRAIESYTVDGTITGELDESKI